MSYERFDIGELSVPERLLLAQELVDSVLSETMTFSPSQLADLYERAKAIDAGDVVCEDWSVVKTRLLNRL